MLEIASITEVFNELAQVIEEGTWGENSTLTEIFELVANTGWDGDP